MKGRKPVDTEADILPATRVDALRYRRAVDLLQIADICGLLPKLSAEDRRSLRADSGTDSPYVQRLKEALLDASQIYEIAAKTQSRSDSSSSEKDSSRDHEAQPLTLLIHEAWNEVMATNPGTMTREEAMTTLKYQNEWCFIRFLSLYRYPYPKDAEINTVALNLLRGLNKVAGAIGGRGRTYNHRAGRKLYPQSTSEVVTEEWLAKQIAEGFFRTAAPTS